MNFFRKLFTSDAEASSKRFVCVILVCVHIIALFLLMYFRIEILNRDLVGNALHDNFWLILIFGGFIAAEPVLTKLRMGGPKNIVNQDVKEQTVITGKDETVK